MIFFVVPAYNEELNIATLIEKTDSHAEKFGQEYRLIIVDDGSRDKTSEIVREKSKHLPVTLVSYQPNRGVQEAFARGLFKALESSKDADVIVTMEADGTADWEVLPVFLEKIKQRSEER